MSERKTIVRQLIEGLHQMGPGRMGAVLGMLVGILFVVFGFWKTLFILLFALGGYYLGVRYFSSRERFRALLDRIFPPGLFR